MDFNSIRDTVSNLTLYDVKAGIRKVQNAVMNYTEMEAKVREATNNEPWGASSSLMQEIANGTFNYQTLNEIMPMIYRRFTEKSAEEWRQIYKALQLLEFLIKHGSERVIDDARSHLTLLKMLRQFHFIDQNGKDQGINVRNRAKELAELLSDVERIRAERKKARTNKAKYTGVEGGSGGLSFGGSSSSRYGGFGSESGGYGGGSSSAGYGGYSGGVYGDGGGFGGNTSDFRDSQARSDRFEAYDEYDEGERPAASESSSSRVKRTSERAGVKKTVPVAEPPKKKKEPEVDLFAFDEPKSGPAPAAAAAPLAAPSNGSSGLEALAGGANDDDDFDDFQSAAPIPAPMTTSNASSAQFAAPKPVSAPQQANLSSMVGLSSISPTTSSTTTPAANFSAFSPPTAMPANTTGSTSIMSPMTIQSPKASGYQPSTPNYFSAVPLPATQHSRTTSAAGVGVGMGAGMGGAAAAKPAAGKSSGGGDAFGALWSQASQGIKKTSTPSGAGPAMGQLAKEKSSAGIWGAPAAASTPSASSSTGGAKQTGGSHGLDDLLG